jgi:cysteinyl-tRNA synthetase
MLTVNGTRMSKSAGNGFLPKELFTGSHSLLERGYSPMTVRFFMSLAHYRSTLDFSNEALQAAEKGYKKLMESLSTLEKLTPSATSSADIAALRENCYAAMNDDFNSPVLVSHLFEAVRIINSTNDGNESLTIADIEVLKETMQTFVFDVLGLLDETKGAAADSNVINGLMNLIIDIRKTARENRDWATSDKIRDELKTVGVDIKDTKDGVTWKI